MVDEQRNQLTSLEEYRSSLAKTGKVLEAALLVIAGIFAVVALVSTIQYIVGAVGIIDGPGKSAESASVPLLSIVPPYVFVAMLVEAALVFRDISHGESPFTGVQVKRVRFIAWLLLAYAVLDTLVPRGVLVDGGQIGNAPGLIHSYSGSEYYGINVGWFVVAMVFFALSSIFKYGVELQELSDDTV